jgi:hypothetical protein
MNQQTLKAMLDPLARKSGLYLSYELDEKEFVGSIVLESRVVATNLKSKGYTETPNIAGIHLQASKEHPETNALHEYSLRRIDPKNRRKQYHVHLFTHHGKTEIFSHHEYRPDLRVLQSERITGAIQRLQTHYRPTWGQDYHRGMYDTPVGELVE